jgi:flagellar biosynthesis/type III secretory pathway chaperone
VDKVLTQVYQKLQKLVGLHRQLLEAVRTERESLVQADLNSIHSVTSIKQTLIESINQLESERVKSMGELAVFWKKPYRELTLPNIIIRIQGDDPKGAEQLRSVFNTLNVLIQRISEQNKDNRALIEKSLEHLGEMKKNILGESSPHSSTYTQQGYKMNNSKVSRLLSKEA